VPATAPSNRGPARRSRLGAGKRRSVRARPNGHELLFGQDPELRGALSELPNALSRGAKGLSVATWRLATGPWEPEDNSAIGKLDCGCLILEGTLPRGSPTRRAEDRSQLARPAI
jgi:hypothetical protein